MEVITDRLKYIAENIINGPVRPVHLTWEIIVHAGNVNFKPFKLVSMDIQRDYANNYTDTVNIEILTTLGHYSTYVYPNRNNLKISIVGYHVGEQSDALVPGSIPIKRVYQANLINVTENKLSSSESGAGVKLDTAEFEKIYNLDLQLVDLTMEQVRLVAVGGVFRKTTAMEVLKTLLHVGTDNLEIDQGLKIKGINYVEPNVNKERNHVLVPHGSVKLVDLAGYLQAKEGGIYNNGISLYMQNLYWYIYPTFDCSRYSKEAYSLTVLILTGNNYIETEKTYSFDNNKLIVLAQGNVDHNDPKNQMQLNKGNGVRFMNPLGILNDEYLKTGENKAVVNKKAILTEVVTEERKNGLNNSQFNNNTFTDNAAYELSKISMQNGQLMTVTWKYCNIDLIAPGLPCKVMYGADGNVIELEGVVLQTTQTTQSSGIGVTETRYRNIGTITMFVTTPSPIVV